MLSRLGWGNNWFTFGLVIFIGTVIMVLATLLTFVWKFDVHTSPVWQVVVYHLMLALLLSLTFLVASRRLFPFDEWFRRGMLALAVLLPVAVFVGGWVTGGAYMGFRDERTFDLMVLSVSSFVFIWITIAFPYAIFVFGKALFRYWRRGELPDWDTG